MLTSQIQYQHIQQKAQTKRNKFHWAWDHGGFSLGLRSWMFFQVHLSDIYIYIFDLKENTNDINQFPESSVLHDSTCKTAWPPELLSLTKKGRTMNFLQLVDQMIKAVHCFEGLTLRELDFQLFWRDVFLISIHYNPWIRWFLLDLSPSTKQAWSAGPFLVARGKSEVSQLRARASATGTSLNNDTQGSLNALHI